MKKLFMIACVFACFGCTPKMRIYKVTFNNGDTDYFELNYKPKHDAKSIEYYDETILGIQKLEEIK